MGKTQKRAKRFNYSKNRRRAWQKQKKLPSIGCAQVKAAWDEKKSLQSNLKEMGLSSDPNKTLRIPTTKELVFPSAKRPRPKKSETASKLNVLEELEHEASVEQPCRLKMSDPEERYCSYMIEKYGEDYKAMACDERNYYQDTPKQIRRKILKFQSLPKLKA